MTREFYEWANFWWENAPDKTAQRIMLIGDSITNGYKNAIQNLLRDRGVLVDMAVGSRSVEDPALFAEINYALSEIHEHKYKVIHFNNGLHGSHLNSEDFERGLRNIITLIQTIQPEAVLILATCTVYTPLGSEGTIDIEKNKQVIERNAIIKKLADEFLLPIDDLFSAVAGNKEYPQPDTVHYTSEGYQQLAESATEILLRYIV